jgi:hypothetical protein
VPVKVVEAPASPSTTPPPRPLQTTWGCHRMEVRSVGCMLSSTLLYAYHGTAPSTLYTKSFYTWVVDLLAAVGRCLRVRQSLLRR